MKYHRESGQLKKKSREGDKMSSFTEIRARGNLKLGNKIG
jgi:hypothetical protein